MPDEKPLVFVSYSHKDEQWREQLRPHLEALEQVRDVEYWDDRKGIRQGDVWFDEIDRKLKELSKIERETWRTEVTNSLVPTAYAQSGTGVEQEPSWMSDPPGYKGSLYFVGISKSRSLLRAKDYSYKDAAGEAVDHLVLEFARRSRMLKSRYYEFDIEMFTQHLVDGSEVLDTYYSFDREAGLYHYFTLLAVDKRLAIRRARLFELKSQKRALPSVTFPPRIRELEIKGLPEDYYLGKISAHKKISAFEKKSLAYDEYIKFIKAREVRKMGHIADAIDLLEEVTGESPAFYLGWYNIALAYDALDSVSLADQACEIAAGLEQDQLSGDASFHSTYGNFLYRHNKYQEATAALEKALQIAPQHPTARRTLQELGGRW